MATELVVVHSGSGLCEGVGHHPLCAWSLVPPGCPSEESIAGSARCFDGIMPVAKLGTGGLVKVSVGVPSSWALVLGLVQPRGSLGPGWVASALCSPGCKRRWEDGGGINPLCFVSSFVKGHRKASVRALTH